MTPTTISDSPSLDLEAITAPPTPPALPEPGDEKPFKLPEKLEVENYSQARRLALRFFGPLVRLHERNFPEGKLFEVSLPRNVLGAADTWKQAIEMAVQVVQQNEKNKEPTAGLIQERSRNVILAMRMSLFNTLPGSYAGEEKTDVMFGVLGLRDHQLFEVQKLARGTIEGPLDQREPNAKLLKAILMEARKRFHTQSKV